MSEPLTAGLEPSQAIKERFLGDQDGLAAVQARSDSVDEMVTRSFERHFPADRALGVAAAAVGGYGRAQLFPHSDIDLLILVGRRKQAALQESPISGLLTELWDAKLRVSQSVRTVGECTQFTADNPELFVSLLNSRYLAGDQRLFDELGYDKLPRFFQREQASLLKNLVELAHGRHRRFGRTIYHLEPDVKDAPGTLRDFHVACWISQLTNASADRVPESEEFLPSEFQETLAAAKRFLFGLRCYVHYFNGRDNNKLSFDLQDQIAEASLGKSFDGMESTEAWMRQYFRNVRIIHRLAVRMLDEAAASRRSLFLQIRDRSSRLSNSTFAVSRGRVYLRQSRGLELKPGQVFDLFEFMGRHGVPLALETERRINRALTAIGAYVQSSDDLWPAVARILSLPHAYKALTAMHETGVLFSVFPELRLIDCLVVRDFYHRYTVDEHSFRSISKLHTLGETSDPLTPRFQSLLSELEQPEHLYFALLFHDVGKGEHKRGHSDRSVALAEQAMGRLGVAAAGRETVGFLIRQHLVISEFMRTRDLSDPATARELAEIVGTPDRLKALTLMTLADASAVNPSAMTPWRKDLLWQLYVAVFNDLAREVEDHRIESGESEPYLEPAESPKEREALGQFLRGFPHRYVRTHTPQQVYSHFQLSQRLADKKSAVHGERRHSVYEFVVTTQDRPHLFASLCGTFAAYGLNIEKAEAFANNQGLVLDTFIVNDPQRRLDAGPDEAKHLSRMLGRVAEDRADVRELLRARQGSFQAARKTRVQPAVGVDNETSSRATIFHVTTQDRLGLLYDLAGKISERDYDIEVVLIDTQGHRAIDVFYVVGPDGAKLHPESSEVLREELLEVCRGTTTA